MLLVCTLRQCSWKAASGRVILYADPRIGAKRPVSPEECTEKEVWIVFCLHAAAAYKESRCVDESTRAMCDRPFQKHRYTGGEEGEERRGVADTKNAGNLPAFSRVARRGIEPLFKV